MRPAVAGTLIVCALLGASDARAQRPPSNSHAIYMTAVEFKGSTTTDKLAPPQVDPTKLSHGYAKKGPARPIQQRENAGRWRRTSSVRLP